MQTTIGSAHTFRGIGLHSGRPARLTVQPAPAGHGIRFRRLDVTGADPVLPARYDLVDRSPLCTRLVNADGVSVSTVEHVMAALAGCGVHNALIDIDGPEVPILDGSARPFVRGILSCGVRRLSAPVEAIEILAPVTVRRGDSRATLRPGTGLTMHFAIDFDEAGIGRQSRSLDLSNGAFVRELCDSRTFCRRSDVDTMQANGLALGGMPGANAIVFDGAEIEAGPHGLRHADEPVRHKMLDALGDLALAGAPIFGRYEGERAGHTLTNTLLRALFDRPDAWRRVVCDAAQAARLPGAGVDRSSVPQVA